MSRLRTSIFLIGGVVAVALAAGLSLFFGSTPIPPDQVLGALFSPDMANQEHVAILELRGPRTVGCILVGAAFAVAGAVMQGVTHNPLADSGLLGINAGAAFALALCLALLPGMSFAGVVGCSFVGAAFALAVVFGAVSFRRRNMDPVLLVLAGCAVGLFLTALAQGVAIFFNIGYSLTFWTAGGVAGIRADTLAMTAPFIVAALAASWALARRVTVLSLGEEAASGLGVNVGKSRTLCLLVVLVLAGAAVALAGPAGGLRGPHGAAHGAPLRGIGLPGRHPRLHGGRGPVHAAGRRARPHAHGAERDSHRRHLRHRRRAVLHLVRAEGGDRP